MNFFLTDKQKEMRAIAREFAEKEIIPHVRQNEKERRFPREIIKKMAALGFFGCAFPKAYGGNELGFLCHAIITEEVSRAQSSLRSPFTLQAVTVPLTIHNWGTKEQKDKYVRALINCEMIGCFAMSEPGAGSDVAGLEATALKRGDSFILNGKKVWISYAPVFDVGLVFAKTDPAERHKGLSCFILERSAPGITVVPIKDTLGHYCTPIGEIIFDNCPVPAANLVGNEGEGFKIAANALEHGRLTVAAGALGLAQACLDASVQYANERKAFGQLIGSYQMVKDRIAQMAAELDAARLLVYRSGFLKDQAIRDSLESTTAKYFAAELAVKAANWAVEIHGGCAFSEDRPVARYLRDSKAYQVGEGTTNITKLIIANDALGWKKANR